MGAQLSTVSAVAVAGPAVAGICLRGSGAADAACSPRSVPALQPGCGGRAAVRGGSGFSLSPPGSSGFRYGLAAGCAPGGTSRALVRRGDEAGGRARPGPVLPRPRRGWPCEGWSPHPAVAPPVPRPPAPSAASAMAAFVPPPLRPALLPLIKIPFLSLILC